MAGNSRYPQKAIKKSLMKGPCSKLWTGSKEDKWLRKHPGVSNDQELLPLLRKKSKRTEL